MNDPRPDADLDTLFALARARRPETAAAKYAFETRLLARLRADRSAPSIWARVSWRMIPFFAVAVVVLTLWHEEVASETSEAEQSAYVDSSDFLEGLTNFNL